MTHIGEELTLGEVGLFRLICQAICLFHSSGQGFCTLIYHLLKMNIPGLHLLEHIVETGGQHTDLVIGTFLYPAAVIPVL